MPPFTSITPFRDTPPGPPSDLLQSADPSALAVASFFAGTSPQLRFIAGTTLMRFTAGEIACLTRRSTRSIHRYRAEAKERFSARVDAAERLAPDGLPRLDWFSSPLPDLKAMIAGRTCSEVASLLYGAPVMPRVVVGCSVLGMTNEAIAREIASNSRQVRRWRTGAREYLQQAIARRSYLNRLYAEQLARGGPKKLIILPGTAVGG